MLNNLSTDTKNKKSIQNAEEYVDVENLKKDVSTLKSQVDEIDTSIENLSKEVNTKTVTAGTITGTNITGTAVNAATMSATTISATNVNTEKVKASTAEITKLSGTTTADEMNITSATIPTLKGKVQVEAEVQTPSIKADTITSTNTNTTTITATNGDFRDVAVSNNLNADSASIGDLTVNDIHLNQSSLDVDTINTKETNTDALTTGSIVSEEGTITSLTSDQAKFVESTIEDLKSNKHTYITNTINLDPIMEVESDWYTIEIPNYTLATTFLRWKYNDQPTQVTIVQNGNTAFIQYSQSDLNSIKSISWNKADGRIRVCIRGTDTLEYVVNKVIDEEVIEALNITSTYTGKEFTDYVHVPTKLQTYLFKGFGLNDYSLEFPGYAKFDILAADEIDYGFLSADQLAINNDLILPARWDVLGNILERSTGDEKDIIRIRTRHDLKKPVYEAPIDNDSYPSIIHDRDYLVTEETVRNYDGTAQDVTEHDIYIPLNADTIDADFDTDLFDVEGTIATSDLVVTPKEDPLYEYTPAFTVLTYDGTEWDVDGIEKTSFAVKVLVKEEDVVYPITNLGDNTTTHGNHEIEKDLKVGGEVLAHTIDVDTDVTIRGDLYVEGKTTTTVETQVATSGDYIVARENNPSTLGTNERSGLVINNYNKDEDNNPKAASLTVNTDGVMGISANTTINNTTYTNIISYDGDYFTGLSTDTPFTNTIDIITNTIEDEKGDVVLVDGEFYHYTGADWRGPLSWDSDKKELVGDEVTDEDLITTLESKSKYTLIYYESLTSQSINPQDVQAIATREDDNDEYDKKYPIYNHECQRFDLATSCICGVNNNQSLVFEVGDRQCASIKAANASSYLPGTSGTIDFIPSLATGSKAYIASARTNLICLQNNGTVDRGYRCGDRIEASKTTTGGEKLCSCLIFPSGTDRSTDTEALQYYKGYANPIWSLTKGTKVSDAVVQLQRFISASTFGCAANTSLDFKQAFSLFAKCGVPQGCVQMCATSSDLLNITGLKVGTLTGATEKYPATIEWGGQGLAFADGNGTTAPEWSSMWFRITQADGQQELVKAYTGSSTTVTWTEELMKADTTVYDTSNCGRVMVAVDAAGKICVHSNVTLDAPNTNGLRFGTGNTYNTTTNTSVVLGAKNTLGASGANATIVGISNTVNASGGIAIGCNMSAGSFAIAIGVSSAASGSNAIHLGTNATVSGACAIGIGCAVTSSSTRSIAIGVGSTSSNTCTIAIGSGATANTASSIAIGRDTSAAIANSIAIGVAAKTCTGGSQIAIGNSTIAGYIGDVVIGLSASTGDAGTSNQGGHVVIGRSAKVRCLTATVPTHSAIVIGYNASTCGSYSVVIGCSAYAGCTGVAIGCGTCASNTSGIGIGTKASASGNYAIGIGCGVCNPTACGIAIGYLACTGTSTSPINGIAIGCGARAILSNTIAIGTGACAACASGSIAIGFGTISCACDGVAIGAHACNVYTGPGVSYSNQKIPAHVIGNGRPISSTQTACSLNGTAFYKQAAIWSVERSFFNGYFNHGRAQIFVPAYYPHCAITALFNCFFVETVNKGICNLALCDTSFSSSQIITRAYMSGGYYIGSNNYPDDTTQKMHTARSMNEILYIGSDNVLYNNTNAWAQQSLAHGITLGCWHARTSSWDWGDATTCWSCGFFGTIVW